jgi:hypothetical protein
VKSFETVVELPAPPEVSWAFVVDHGSEIEPLSFEPQGTQGVGTLNKLRGRLFGVIPLRAVSRTIGWDPPSSCRFESVTPSWPVRTHIDERFEASSAGTRHVIRYEVEGRGIIGWLVAPLVAKAMERSRHAYQARLRSALGAR